MLFKKHELNVRSKFMKNSHLQEPSRDEVSKKMGNSN